MDWTDLKAYVNTDSEDDSFVQSCWAEATELVEQYVGASLVPTTTMSRAILEVGSELYNRRKAPNGITQYNTLDGSAIRIARDPMKAALPLLSPFMVMGL